MTNLFTSKPTESQVSLNPRDYQVEAVQAVWDYMRTEKGNPCVVAATGSGKSLILSMIIRDALKWGGRVVVLSHVKELLEQNAKEIEGFLPGVRCGVYSAGLNRRELDEAVTVAGIQSIHNRAFELCGWDAPKLVIVDEAHLISEASQSRYQRFLNDLETANPKLRIVGLTATPFRTGEGLLCGPNRMLNKVVYEIGIAELIERGYLCEIRSKNAQTDTSGLKIRSGEFVASEAQSLMMEITASAISEMLAIAKVEDRKSGIIFCQTVEHGNQVAELLRDNNQSVAEIYGDTPKTERKELITKFKAGKIKYLVNVNVLTIGFNAPCVDLLVLLRATVSPGLYVQMVGRCSRLHEGKQDARVLDYGGNIDRHGPVNRIKAEATAGKGDGEAPHKTCPDCAEVVFAGVSFCVCGHQFPKPEPAPKIEPKTEQQQQVIDKRDRFEDLEVTGATYTEWTKRNAPDDAPKTLRVDYKCGASDVGGVISEWVCIEHTGFAGNKAREWWGKRCRNPMPATSALAAEMAEAGFVAPEMIRVDLEENPKFPRVIAYKFPAGFEPIEIEIGPEVAPLGDCFVCGFAGQYGGCGKVECPFGIQDDEEAPF